MPGLLQALLLFATVAVIFVNGWTDAPNAIATAVATRSIRYRPAVWLAALCNLAGIVAMSFVSASVADTMVAMARFDGGTPVQAMAALCAALLAIVLFAVGAWAFGIPTSESHALIAALTGASLALGGRAGIDSGPWSKVLWGLLLSVGFGLGLGWLLARLLRRPLGRCGDAALGRLQVVCAGGMAFMHGAQDGQKFIAVLVTVDLLCRGRYGPGPIQVREHLPALLLCAVAMALGTSVGGKRIIETVGEKMTSLDRKQGVCADLAGGICLFVASLSGIPMSTTHTKTTAIMGVGLGGGRGAVNPSVMGGMLLAWAVTFPACGLLGFGFAKLLLHVVA